MAATFLTVAIGGPRHKSAKSSTAPFSIRSGHSLIHTWYPEPVDQSPGHSPRPLCPLLPPLGTISLPLPSGPCTLRRSKLSRLGGSVSVEQARHCASAGNEFKDNYGSGRSSRLAVPYIWAL